MNPGFHLVVPQGLPRGPTSMKALQPWKNTSHKNECRILVRTSPAKHAPHSTRDLRRDPAKHMRDERPSAGRTVFDGTNGLRHLEAVGRHVHENDEGFLI